MTPIGAIAIGWPKAKDKPSPSLKIVGRRPREQVVHWGRWGAHERPDQPSGVKSASR